MNAKVMVIDTDTVDLKALGTLLGVDLEKAVAEATGEVADAEVEGGCDCEVCVDEVEVDDTFGDVTLEDENDNRTKIAFKLDNLDTVKVTEEEGGVSVVAQNKNGQEFDTFVDAPESYKPSRTSAHLVNGELVIRFYKLTPAQIGREIEIQKW